VQRCEKALKEIQDDRTYNRILAKYSNLKVEPITDDQRKYTRGSIWWGY
jgi:hypothetical protein